MRHCSSLAHETGYAPLQLYGAKRRDTPIAALWRKRLDLRHRSSMAQQDRICDIAVPWRIKTGYAPLQLYVA